MSGKHKTNNDPIREFVKSMLRNHGLNAFAIPESSSDTPDLSLPVAENRILIEVKLKQDDEQFRGLVESPAGTTRFYKISTLESLLKGAWHQIKNFSDRTDRDFALIWLVAINPGITTFVRPASMTLLYGIQTIEGLTEESDSFYEKDCFFFGYSFLHRRKMLDGVVLHDNHQITMYLNPFSERYNSFRQTPLVELFRREFELIDPKVIEEAGQCFIADCRFSRKDTNSVVLYLKKKYGLKTVKLTKFVLMNCPVE